MKFIFIVPISILCLNYIECGIFNDGFHFSPENRLFVYSNDNKQFECRYKRFSTLYKPRWEVALADDPQSIINITKSDDTYTLSTYDLYVNDQTTSVVGEYRCIIDPYQLTLSFFVLKDKDNTFVTYYPTLPTLPFPTTTRPSEYLKPNVSNRLYVGKKFHLLLSITFVISVML
ncbi:hypothetical protein SNEBB_001407 [Seison nebaliae]|nr:hypothetical protein SNEBB_001407 [Seison nebaliae]